MKDSIVKLVVQSYFDFHSYWNTVSGSGTNLPRLRHDKCKVRTNGNRRRVLGFRRIFCGLFSLSAKKEGRKGLFDKPDTCVLFSPCIRLQTFSYREPACARTIHHFQGKPEFHVEPVISKLEAMILEITAALDTGIMRVDGAYQHCTPSIQ